MPPGSEELSVTITSLLFQPNGVGSGESDAVVVGGVMSVLKVKLMEPRAGVVVLVSST